MDSRVSEDADGNRALVYDLSNIQRGVRDCPHCGHTMERLSSRLSVRTNEGYLLDSGDNEAEAIAYHALGVAGLAMSTLYRHTLLPLISKLSGELHTRRLERTLKSHPESLICRNCNHVIRRK